MGLFDKLFGDNKDDKNSFLDAIKDAAEKLKSEAEKAGFDLNAKPEKPEKPAET